MPTPCQRFVMRTPTLCQHTVTLSPTFCDANAYTLPTPCDTYANTWRSSCQYRSKAMPDNLKIALQNEIKALYKCKNKKFGSKTMIIREIFDDIENARKHGVTLPMILPLLEKMGVNISYSELRQIMCRIRKKNKENETVTKPQDTTPCNKTSPDTEKPQQATSLPAKASQEEFEDLTQKLNAFDEAIGWEERYIALGGDPAEIRSKPASQKRHIAMELKSRLEDRLSIYKR